MSNRKRRVVSWQRRRQIAQATVEAAVPIIAARHGLLVLEASACSWLFEFLGIFDRSATSACAHVRRRAVGRQLYGWLSGALPVYCGDCEPNLLGEGLLRAVDVASCARCDDETGVVHCIARSPRGVLVNLNLCVDCVADYTREEANSHV